MTLVAVRELPMKLWNGRKEWVTEVKTICETKVPFTTLQGGIVFKS